VISDRNPTRIEAMTGDEIGHLKSELARSYFESLKNRASSSSDSVLAIPRLGALGS
jgi:hypothetical protein